MPLRVVCADTIPRFLLGGIIPRMSDSSPRRLLVVKLSSLGDVIHTLPLIEALRVGLGSDAHLVWAVRRAFANLLEGNPHLSAVRVLEGRGLGEAFAFGKQLRAEHFDTALDPQGLFVSGLITFLSGAPRRIGLDLNREGNRLFLTEASISTQVRRHQVEKLLDFCEAVGVPRLAPRVQTYLAQGEATIADEWLAPIGDTGRIGCVIGTSTPAKEWPVERWCELSCRLAEQGLKPVLLGGPSEIETAERIVEETRGAVALNLVGKTSLRQLASVLARCSVVVGGDTGPFHLAIAVGTPAVGLYGVTDPVRVGPSWGPAPAIALDFVEKEAPPERRRTRHPLVPMPLAKIPVVAVLEAVVRLLS